MESIENKVVIITGGGGLIGQSFVKDIAISKGIPIIAEINEDRGNEVKSKISELLQYDNIYSFKCDITCKKSLTELIQNVTTRFGKIDALVNNAYPRNQNYGRHFFDVEYNDFSENLSLNIGGYFLASQLFAEYFIKQGYGNIINIASIYGVVAPRFEIYEGTKMSNSVEYSAIKAGVIHLTKYMAKYFKGKNVRVNSLSLGGIFDNQPEPFLSNYKRFCLNKGMLSTDDITGTLLFLLSDYSQYINGQNIIVDDGFSL